MYNLQGLFSTSFQSHEHEKSPCGGQKCVYKLKTSPMTSHYNVFENCDFYILFTVTCLYVRLPVFKSVAKAECVPACSPNNSRVARWIIGVIGPAVKLMTSC